jgi:predicted TIM-barrel enzyme
MQYRKELLIKEHYIMTSKATKPTVITNTTAAIAEAEQILAALHTAMDNMAQAASGTGEAIQTTADCMVAYCGATWFNLKGKEAKVVKQERAVFMGKMDERGISDGSAKVYWQRVKEASGYVTAGNKAKGEIDLEARTLAELKTMINRILNAEETSDALEEAKGFLISALVALGGSLDN